MKQFCLVAVILVFLIHGMGLLAQPEEGKQFSEPPSVSENTLGKFLSTNELANEWAKASLPFWAMLFGLMALFFMYRLSKGQMISGADTPRYFILTLIIVSALIFICGKFEDKEITPAIGLFGTIAGYVLGRSDRKEAAREGDTALTDK